MMSKSNLEDKEEITEKPCHDLRFYTAKELLQTEENYVTTLTTIIKVAV